MAEMAIFLYKNPKREEKSRFPPYFWKFSKVDEIHVFSKFSKTRVFYQLSRIAILRFSKILKCSKLSRYSIFFTSDRRFVIFSTSKIILTTFENFLFLEIFQKKTWKKFSKVFKFFWFLVIFRHILVRKHFDPPYFWNCAHFWKIWFSPKISVESSIFYDKKKVLMQRAARN